MMHFGSLYCKQYGPRSDCSLGTSLIRAHSVCFHQKSSLKLNLIYAVHRINGQTFSGQKYFGRIRIKKGHHTDIMHIMSHASCLCSWVRCSKGLSFRKTSQELIVAELSIALYGDPIILIKETLLEKTLIKISAMVYKFEPVHEISNNVVCVTSKASDQPAHRHSLIRASASCLSFL